MKQDSIIMKRIAPCGLHCGGCFAFDGGNIQTHSEKLQRVLGNFDEYAQRFVTLLDEPQFRHYPEFKNLLYYFSKAKCKGCREQSCALFKNCEVRNCYKEKGVDFCYQCNSFPCSHTGFDEHLYKRYVTINNRIKEIGIEKYYEEIKDIPRY